MYWVEGAKGAPPMHNITYKSIKLSITEPKSSKQSMLCPKIVETKKWNQLLVIMLKSASLSSNAQLFLSNPEDSDRN